MTLTDRHAASCESALGIAAAAVRRPRPPGPVPRHPSPRQLAAHPGGHSFTFLPRPGTVRAARLLAEIGDRVLELAVFLLALAEVSLKRAEGAQVVSRVGKVVLVQVGDLVRMGWHGSGCGME
jgi:hypothetical protein